MGLSDMDVSMEAAAHFWGVAGHEHRLSPLIHTRIREVRSVDEPGGRIVASERNLWNPIRGVEEMLSWHWNPLTATALRAHISTSPMNSWVCALLYVSTDMSLLAATPAWA